MPSEYTTPVLDFVALAAEQFPHQTHQQFSDQLQPQQQQQQHQQQQQQSSPLAIPMLMPVPISPVLSLNLSLGSATTQTTQPTQSTQAKICAICHCALIPESSEIVDILGVHNVVCTSCVAGEMVQYPRRQLQQQQVRLQPQQTEDLESSLHHSLSGAPIAAPGPPLSQFPSVIVIPPSASISLSPAQNATPLSLLEAQGQTTQHTIILESQQIPLPVHRSPPMPIGSIVFDEDKGRDDDDGHVDNERQTFSASTCESESKNGGDGENVEMLDGQKVQDSLGLASVPSGLDPGSSSMHEESGQALHQPLLSGQLGSLHPPLVVLPLSSRQQPSLFSAPLLPSRTQGKAEGTVEPLAQVAYPSSRPFTSPFDMSSLYSTTSIVTSSSSSPSSSHSRRMKFLEPDPLTDISRLRVRSHTQDCLYPGAQFCGTQKSGRNSYDVSVTIVDVDFQSSFLCGYLHIRDLTDDWPELTTYFDAQIIGSRYGFLTQDWGATETEDVTHWSRFPAYDRVKPLISGPKMNIPDDARLGSGGAGAEGDVESSHSKGSASGPRTSPPVYGPGNGGCVFMRWKERFLVPDHRVRDINGASFAGFYYVCVEFNPARSNASLKRRRKKVERKSSNTHARRDAGVPVVREGEEEPQIRDQVIFATSLNSNTSANAKPPDTDVEMDEVEDFGNARRERPMESVERRFVGMEMEMDMDMDVEARDVSTPPSRSRSLIRGAAAVNSSRSRSRSHIRRRRRREEHRYERYRENVVLGNTTSAAVPASLSNSNPSLMSYSSSNPPSRNDISQQPVSHSLPLSLPSVVNSDDGCDDISMPYRGWAIAREREREREHSRERRRGRLTERRSHPGTQNGQNSVPFPQQSLAQDPIASVPARTVLEPESDDSGSEYEYEYEYDENVYTEDPAYDDTLGSTPGGPYTATMSGYYFHQHSEPYQQLSLRYVPRRSTGSFEFR